MKPFSDNIIFWDTEFTSLDPYKGELLSLAFVKPDGSELYIELDYKGDMDEWVKQNVIPTLTQPKISREEAIQKMTEFMGPSRPFLVAYVNQFDTIYLYKLLKTDSSTKNYPFHWMQLDISSMLFGLGIDPERFSFKHKDSLVKELGIDFSKYKEHNALDDARLLRDIYLKLVEQN
jgi:DNA polymerase III epsilon subunit-like protein